MSKLVKNSTEIAPAGAFADAVERAHVDEALACPALERCPACGSLNMKDPQAQFVGACSARCAKSLGISDEVLRMSGSVPPSQLGVVDLCAAESPILTANGQRAVCSRLIDHDGRHKGNEPVFDEQVVTWATREAW